MAKSIFRNALDRVVEARRREADRYVSRALLSLDDTTLAAIGKSREELRRKAHNSYVFW
ncbi:hypothetical protein [Agrobacterium larrymoorei]|uniref:DUF1127 domain-containing protein n=1 Tax=Agrobacterium larrymoorei TaxID=160699 RepID=A0ABX8T1F8_9HYPH|nr:hypothetical protein [Agrobacterium larrymoorei]QYA07107.1 hypothetical protein J5285_14005 [Agrobacterium larrymoorei]